MIFSKVAGITTGSKEPWGYVFIYSLGSDCTAFSGTPLHGGPYDKHYAAFPEPELTAKERTRKFTSELNMKFYRGRSRHDEDVPRGRRLRRR